MRRRIRSTAGDWFSRSTAERWVAKGIACWQGNQLEILRPLNRTERRRMLHDAQLRVIEHDGWEDGRPVIPVSPEWLKRMGYR